MDDELSRLDQRKRADEEGRALRTNLRLVGESISRLVHTVTT